MLSRVERKKKAVSSLKLTVIGKVSPPRTMNIQSHARPIIGIEAPVLLPITPDLLSSLQSTQPQKLLWIYIIFEKIPKIILRPTFFGGKINKCFSWVHKKKNGFTGVGRQVVVLS